MDALLVEFLHRIEALQSELGAHREALHAHIADGHGSHEHPEYARVESLAAEVERCISEAADAAEKELGEGGGESAEEEAGPEGDGESEPVSVPAAEPPNPEEAPERKHVLHRRVG